MVGYLTKPLLVNLNLNLFSVSIGDGEAIILISAYI